jgi:glutamine---fructose-6-phosphate transaminase (isomerizing)
VGVTNTVGSAIATATDCGIHVNAGCEIGVASTKAYTSQIVAITLLALVMAEDSVSRKRKYNAVVSALRHLPDSVRRVRLFLCLHVHLQPASSVCRPRLMSVLC